MNDLPRVTWLTAATMNWWPSKAFRSVGIPPGTVRRWAHEGRIDPVALGPRGSVLYRFENVVKCRSNTRE